MFRWAPIDQQKAIPLNICLAFGKCNDSRNADNSQPGKMASEMLTVMLIDCHLLQNIILPAFWIGKLWQSSRM